jgi:bifunctional DNA primase/polymerase-like protein
MTRPQPAEPPGGRGDAATGPRLLAAALSYAAAGIAVMPLYSPTDSGCTCAAGPGCSSAGKHPRLRHGLHEASTDPGQVRRWWTRWPYANLGLATGNVLDVCDVDTPDALRRLLDLLDVIRPSGPLVRTGQGWHLWYASDGLPNRVAVIPGVDWRGTGGLVVAPPSLHATGNRYRFAQQFTLPLPPVPTVLRRLVAPLPPPAAAVPVEVGDQDRHDQDRYDQDRYGQAALTGEIHRIRAAPRPAYTGGRRTTGGGRNNALVRAAFRLGQLAGTCGLDEHTVFAQLTDAAASAGLSTAEAHRTITSGWRAGLRHPRTRTRPVHHLRR